MHFAKKTCVEGTSSIILILDPLLLVVVKQPYSLKAPPPMISQILTDTIDNIPNCVFAVFFDDDFRDSLVFSNRAEEEYVKYHYWYYNGTPTLELWCYNNQHKLQLQSSLPLSEQEHVQLWKEAIQLEPKLKDLLSNLS